MFSIDQVAELADQIEEVTEAETSEFVRLFTQLHRQVAELEQTEHQLLRVLYGTSES